MTHETLMTTDELRELAALDVFGLLDEAEADRFNRSFHHAHASVQDEIIEIQMRFSTDPIFQSLQEPPARMRSRILAVVHDEYEKYVARLAPTAGGTISRSNSSSMRHTREQHTDTDTQLKREGVHPWWRVVAFAMAACLILSISAMLYISADSREISRLALDHTSFNQLAERIGPTFEDFINNPSVTPCAFSPVPGTAAGVATIYLNPRSGQAFLLTLDLDDDVTYTLRARVGDGEAVDMLEFQSNGFLASSRFDFDPADLNVTALTSITWEIVERETGKVLLIA